MGSVREEIAELGIETTSYEGQGISMHLSKKDIKQILSLVCKRIEGAKLNNEELDHILLTEDDLKEIEQMATIGVEPDDHISYVQNFQMAYDDKLKRKTTQAQLQHSIDAIKEE